MEPLPIDTRAIVELRWDMARGLVDGAPHRVEGAVATRLQGVPVPCAGVDIAVVDNEKALHLAARDCLRCGCD